VAQERASLREERLAWARAIDAAQQDKHGEAFARQLKLFESLASKQVKDILMDMNEDLAANYLSAMKREMAADVMSRFKNPQERQFLDHVLERMRKSS
jgi:Mg/Co/Ni transporter MgtE